MNNIDQQPNILPLHWSKNWPAIALFSPELLTNTGVVFAEQAGLLWTAISKQKTRRNTLRLAAATGITPSVVTPRFPLDKRDLECASGGRRRCRPAGLHQLSKARVLCGASARGRHSHTHGRRRLISQTAAGSSRRRQRWVSKRAHRRCWYVACGVHLRG